MFVKNISDCSEFTANDGCRIRELLHPKNDPVDLPCSLAHARLTPGNHSCRHRLKQTEVYYILKGQGMMHIGNDSREVSSGDIILIPAEAVQWIENSGDTDLIFLALVSPPWKNEDDERIE